MIKDKLKYVKKIVGISTIFLISPNPEFSNSLTLPSFLQKFYSFLLLFGLFCCESIGLGGLFEEF